MTSAWGFDDAPTRPARRVDQVERVQSRGSDASGRAVPGTALEEAVVSLLLTAKGSEYRQVGCADEADGPRPTPVSGWDLGKSSPPFQLDMLWHEGERHFSVEVKNSALAAAWRQQNSLAAWIAGMRARLDLARAGADAGLVPLLLRTAEEATGLASCTSGLLHGLGKSTPSCDGLAREAAELLRAIVPNPEAEYAPWVEQAVLETLASKYEVSDPAEPAQPVGVLVHFLDQVENVAAALRAVVQDILLGGVQRITHLTGIPRHESSPCGVARLASPIVPGAPGLGLTTVPIDFVLAV
ncbi:hypothetical protein [Streptomyces sp. NPDC088755]|uniref:hypothetical protein n=1 Tax=Streptomyces sp. NPDC088755 TaxID=3365888 RepID=UPI00381BEB63